MPQRKQSTQYKTVQNFITALLTSCSLFLAFPAGSTYKLHNFEFGAGGQDQTNGSTYTLEGIFGQTAGKTSGTTYAAGGGMVYSQLTNTPPAPTFVNSSSWYNKLKITLNTASNPSDTEYAIAITDDNWVTTKWVQNDNTVGTTLGIEDYQTYTEWGGASGTYIIGLTGNTTYKVKVKAIQGDFSEGPLGPEASAATSSVSISFDLDVASTNSETASPYSVGFGDVAVGSVSTASDKIWVDLSTNAELGAYVYIHDQYGGLRSTGTNYTISSGSVDLTGQSEGFGLQSASVSESSGGPLVALSPYNGASQNVGLVDTTARGILSTSDSPITSGRASLSLKAKASNSTPAADDYTDTLTLITAGSF